jgi:heterotetrameric sarcosine oxidase gamma subunit
MSGSSNSRALESHPPFANLPFTSAPGGGVIAADRSELAIARIAARKGWSSALAQRARERFGIELPQGPRRVAANGLAVVGVGVESWLALSETGLSSVARFNANGFAGSLRQAIDDVATVSDQIGSYAILRLTGPRVRDALAKFVPLDLHERVFDRGSAAATMGSHIPLTLWRLDDGAGGVPVFEVAAPRSYAESFWHVITQSSAEFGFVLAAAAG